MLGQLQQEAAAAAACTAHPTQLAVRTRYLWAQRVVRFAVMLLQAHSALMPALALTETDQLEQHLLVPLLLLPTLQDPLILLLLLLLLLLKMAH
jgi:hypothetical protein